MSSLTWARRGFLRLSSLIPLTALSGATQADDPAFCADVPEHPEVGPGDIQFNDVKTALWDEFESGTKAMGETPTISVATKNQIIADVSSKLRRKVRFWTLCETETRLCCFSAGVIADAERRAASESEIKFDHYEVAKTAVKQLQAKRLGEAPTGIAC